MSTVAISRGDRPHHPLANLSESLRTNADDRLPCDPVGRVEGRDGIVEGRDGADVRPQASVPHPLDDLTQLGTIGLDDEVDCQAVGGPRLGRPYVIRPHSAGLVQFAANAWLERATAVWGAVTVRAMHRLLVLYPPPSDPDHFRSYYEDTHLPLVAKFPGLRGYRYSFDVAAGEGESPYYCVFEADFDDAAALSAAQESTEGQAVRADVPNYATGGVVVLNYELRAG